ncbi:MAG TPA: hypothetical protein O0X39_06400 [Methanocorpusculum sp.]|nr:hypothetical protein [Methanocorpusculum sp.]
MKVCKKTVRILCGAAVLGLITLISPAAAYVDPSVMTYAIQAVAGVVIVVGVTVGVVWRRFKNKAKKALKIDESGKKELEEDVVADFDEKKN